MNILSAYRKTNLLFHVGTFVLTRFLPFKNVGPLFSLPIVFVRTMPCFCVSLSAVHIPRSLRHSSAEFIGMATAITFGQWIYNSCVPPKCATIPALRPVPACNTRGHTAGARAGFEELPHLLHICSTPALAASESLKYTMKYVRARAHTGQVGLIRRGSNNNH